MLLKTYEKMSIVKLICVYTCFFLIKECARVHCGVYGVGDSGAGVFVSTFLDRLHVSCDVEKALFFFISRVY